MSTSRRFNSSIKLLILPLLVGLGATTGRLDTRDQVREGTAFGDTLSDRQIQVFREILPRFMESPCDTEVFDGINQVHDCQRFITEAREFGSLIGMMPNLEFIEQPAAYYTTARVVAYITNAGGRLPDDAGTTTYTDDGYPQLGIGPKGDADSRYPGGYCLWLHDEREVGWRAAMIPTRGPGFNTDSSCATEPEGTAWEQLQVTRQTYGSAPDTLYANTARWQWTRPGDLTGEHYIVIKCGAAICAITRRGVAPLPIPPPSDERNWRVAIPGWQDAQFLAVAVEGSAGQLTPGPWGEVHPLSKPTTDYSTYANVARYAVWGNRAAVGPYVGKLKLYQVGPEFWGSWLQIQTTGPTTEPLARYQNWSDPPSKARDVITAVGSGSLHGAHHSARFRWHLGDETTWVPCPSFGCCDVSECDESDFCEGVEG